MTVELKTLSFYKTEQDLTDSVQNTDLEDGLLTKADVNKNIRSYFDVATSTLYTTDDNSDPQPG